MIRVWRFWASPAIHGTHVFLRGHGARAYLRVRGVRQTLRATRQLYHQ